MLLGYKANSVNAGENATAVMNPGDRLSVAIQDQKTGMYHIVYIRATDETISFRHDQTENQVVLDSKGEFQPVINLKGVTSL